MSDAIRGPVRVVIGAGALDQRDFVLPYRIQIENGTDRVARGVIVHHLLGQTRPRRRGQRSRAADLARRTTATARGPAAGRSPFLQRRGHRARARDGGPAEPARARGRPARAPRAHRPTRTDCDRRRAGRSRARTSTRADRARGRRRNLHPFRRRNPVVGDAVQANEFVFGPAHVRKPLVPVTDRPLVVGPEPQLEIVALSRTGRREVDREIAHHRGAEAVRVREALVVQPFERVERRRDEVMA